MIVLELIYLFLCGWMTGDFIQGRELVMWQLLLVITLIGLDTAYLRVKLNESK